MFRTTLTMIGVLLFAGVALAQDTSQTPSVARDTSAGTNEALEIMKDHMRSQLDWRSYFTNRMDARRRASAEGNRIRQEPRAADADRRLGKAIELGAEEPGRP